MKTTVNNVKIELIKSNNTYFLICNNLINGNSAQFNVGKRLQKAEKCFNNKVKLHS